MPLATTDLQIVNVPIDDLHPDPKNPSTYCGFRTLVLPNRGLSAIAAMVGESEVFRLRYHGLAPFSLMPHL
jgi:hypothetical protein